ncbi:NAD-dependent epimerase/dehydratase family protein [Streptomyces sp. RPA4-2]|uniref:NAD-dependent epimerase/dehydratase family protein n=1 Tax=Streptomyces sp. RPA4-2 TaxID=2721244 RepID=UPI00143E6F57|nr:NAD-dependent epimerase/dehydratase family protein [Streptomyces sp. RPA4-2]QIY66152.1 NAD-dependent epimerase/dehydratase family protein [Streptomyces sp. RPA4-2]
MRVVVAGATGLIGSRTVTGLRDHGVEVVPVVGGAQRPVEASSGADGDPFAAAELRLRDATAEVLTARGRPRPVITDTRAPFFGAVLGERALLPRPDAHL